MNTTLHTLDEKKKLQIVVFDGAVARPVPPAAAGVDDGDDYTDAHHDDHHNEGCPEKEMDKSRCSTYN